MEWVQEQSRGWLAGVVAMLRRVVEAAPDQPGGWEKLGATQLMAGDAEASCATLREACGRFPDHVGVRLQRARSEMARGRYEDALEAVDSALRIDPESADGRELRFSVLVKLGDLERAEEALRDSTESGAATLSLLHFGVGRARERGDWRALLEICDGILAQSPGNTGGRYYRALALLRMGRTGEAELDPGAFLWEGSLPLAEGEAEFLAGVRREILANPTLAPDPRGFTTTHGMQTRQLLQPGDRALPALCARIREAVDRYAAELAASGCADAFVVNRPARAKLTPWAVVYPGEGKQRSHIHAPGWVSGVYYVAAPPGGELLLGAMDKEDAPEGVPWQVKRIQPRENLLVLFPSFIPHATEATHAGELRICVAFDVVPQ